MYKIKGLRETYTLNRQRKLDDGQPLVDFSVDIVGKISWRGNCNRYGAQLRACGGDMINPNICKYVVVKVLPRDGVTQYALYRGVKLPINDEETKPLGNRRMYLKFSILNDRYYLRSK
jgi:hypothetical protein